MCSIPEQNYKLLQKLNSAQNWNQSFWDFILLEFWYSADGVGIIICTLKWLRQRRQRKQKQGKRGGLRAKLKANPYKPVIPSLFLTNSQSLNNKMDELHLWITFHSLEYCVLIITETRLDRNSC